MKFNLFNLGESATNKELNDYTKILENQAKGIPKTNKGYNGKTHAIIEPFPSISLGAINPGYRDKPFYNGVASVNATLKTYSNNSILNAILNTRSGQVLSFCQPVGDSQEGVGFTISFDDPDIKPTAREKELFKRLEKEVMNMGVSYSNHHMDLHKFIKMFVHDTYVYDQVNFENVYKNGDWLYTTMVDPSTIFFKANEDGQLVTKGKRYVQVIDQRVRREFDDKELAMVIRNPQSDIYNSGYGLSELMVCIREFMAHENTEIFNDRFFSHGGTTRGIINLKQSGDATQAQSRQAMDDFKRMWNVSLQGINGSWQMPVISAPDDIQYVNLTPQARDMEFEKWLNYLIYVISAVFGIDSAEIGFPNKGGATGTKSHSLNEGNSQQKIQESKNKGLRPLMIAIEDAINNYIVKPNFGEEYKFRFIGGDASAELQEIDKLSKQVSTYKTIHEIRKDKKLRGSVPGDDIVLNQYAIQRAAQKIQEESLAHGYALDTINLLKEFATPSSNFNPSDEQEGSSDSNDTSNDRNDKEHNSSNFQDNQHGFDGKQKPSDRAGAKQNGQIRGES